MEPLEGSTLDLLFRRRVKSSAAGYAVMIMVAGMAAALPLVKVDIVSNAPGMVRPVVEPAEIISPLAGTVDSTILMEHLYVNRGDTLVWFRREVQEARIGEIKEKLGHNRTIAADIRLILDGESPLFSPALLQSYRHHLAEEKRLALRSDYLLSGYRTMEELFRQEVIPRFDFEKAQTDYALAKADLISEREQYRTSLENELLRLENENRTNQGTLSRLKSSLKDHVVVAPSTGVILHCRVIDHGSSVPAGTWLGTVSPAGDLVAACYVEPGEIYSVRKGMPVKLTFERRGYHNGYRINSEVIRIDGDVVAAEEMPVYRVFCQLPVSPQFRPGMVCSANLILGRRSLAALLLEKINRWCNPALVTQTEGIPHGEGP